MTHCIQYAIVGDNFAPVVYHTENLSDDEIRAKVAADPLTYGELPIPATIHRFNRCPECEEWTTEAGKLRRGSACPVVVEAMKAMKIDMAEQSERSLPSWSLLQAPCRMCHLDAPLCDGLCVTCYYGDNIGTACEPGQCEFPGCRNNPETTPASGDD